jgi:small subunit ribosomal protein S10
MQGVIGLTQRLGLSRFLNPIRPFASQASTSGSNSASTTTQSTTPDKLFKKIDLEVRGHDKAVLLSYVTFVKNACEHLGIENSPVTHLRYVKWVQPLLRAKFAKKKYKLHYETRTHIKQMSVHNLTGSTASTFLEYTQRNIPEGVAMKVSYEELCALPPTITNVAVN